MKSEKILEIVLREMTAYGKGWRGDWSDFDGRHLQDQLNGIADWAEKALAGKVDYEYTEGTQFYKEE